MWILEKIIFKHAFFSVLHGCSIPTIMQGRKIVESLIWCQHVCTSERTKLLNSPDFFFFRLLRLHLGDKSFSSMIFSVLMIQKESKMSASVWYTPKNKQPMVVLLMNNFSRRLSGRVKRRSHSIYKVSLAIQLCKYLISKPIIFIKTA